VAVGFIGWANNEVPGENYQPTTSQTLSHKVVLKDTKLKILLKVTLNTHNTLALNVINKYYSIL
jgi:hypothetical protein